MYKYETHLHTSPASKCAKASVRESVEFYKKIGYDGVFITNHFPNFFMGTVEEHIEYLDFFYADYEEALKVGKEIGIKVFCGEEISYKGTDFLIYGLNKQWYLDNLHINEMEMSEKLKLFIEEGALVIQAHPYREDFYIDHIRLFPDCVHGVEIVNGRRPESENKMAEVYAKNYGLLEFAGSDNHDAGRQKLLAGVCSDDPVMDIQDFVDRVKNGEMKVFTINNITERE